VESAGRRTVAHVECEANIADACCLQSRYVKRHTGPEGWFVKLQMLAFHFCPYSGRSREVTQKADCELVLDSASIRKLSSSLWKLCRFDPS